MKKTIFTGVLLGYVIHSIASGDNTTSGSRSAAMGNASVTLADVWSAFNNQAGLAEVKSFTGGVFYENRFAVSNLGIKGGVLTVPVKNGAFAADVSSFGYSAYNENRVGIAFGKMLDEKFSAGIRLNYHNIHIGDIYGNKGIVTAELGMLAKLNRNITLGAHVYNPTRAKIAKYNDERLPAILKAGLSYRFSEKVIACAEAEKDIDYKPLFKAGIEYMPLEYLFFRAGISSYPSSGSFGIGLNLKGLKIDISTSSHQALGYSTQVSISYGVNRQKKD